MTQTINKHANYSKTYHSLEAAKQYQKKFNRTWHAQLGARWEMKLTIKALTHAGKMLALPTEKPLSDLTVLDYPCGAGRLATMFASRTAGYIAGDHSPHMVELTSQTLKKVGLGNKLINTTVGDIKQCDLPDQCVDIAACMRLLHHFPDQKDRVKILSQLHRVSRHALIVTYHNAESLKQKRYIRKCKKVGKPCSRVILSPQQFKEEAIQAGWDFVRSWKINSYTSGLRIALFQRHPSL